jgi:sugar lactone lactonase YvrE
MNGRLALSIDGHTIYVPDSSGYFTVATGDLHPTGRRLSGHSLSSLAISPDGKMLFAVQPASNLILEVNAASGEQVATFTLPYPLGILRVEAP